eukprot:3941801-Rhodomonas_salina.1
MPLQSRFLRPPADDKIRPFRRPALSEGQREKTYRCQAGDHALVSAVRHVRGAGCLVRLRYGHRHQDPRFVANRRRRCSRGKKDGGIRTHADEHPRDDLPPALQRHVRTFECGSRRSLGAGQYR